MKIEVGKVYKVKPCGIVGVEKETEGCTCVVISGVDHNGWITVRMLDGAEKDTRYPAIADELEDIYA